MWFYFGVYNIRFPQWISSFTVDLVQYNYAEQLMMASKARLFGDDTALSATHASDYPREHKRLGRQARDFDPELWFILQNSLITKRYVLP